MFLEDEIRIAAREAQLIIDGLYAQGPIDEAGPLNQLGLRDGFSIVEGYIDHGECGVAWEHLFYMVNETGVSLSHETIARMEQVADLLGIKRLPGKDDDDL